MENLELMPMTDFVIMQSDKMYTKVKDRVGEPKYTVLQFITEVPNYAKFLKQKLELWMFVPTDEEGKVLKEPEMHEERNSFDEVDYDYDAQELHEYIKAKGKCLFLGMTSKNVEGYTYIYYNEELIASFPLINADRTVIVEDLIPYKVYLSPVSLKNIGVYEERN